MNNKKIKKLFVVSVFDDGTLRLTERRPMPLRDAHGRWTSDRPHVKIITQATCPQCGAELGLVALG